MKYFIASLVCAIGCLAFAQDESQILIKLGEGKVKKSLVALPPFDHLGNSSANPGHVKTGVELFEVVKNNLDASTLFILMAQQAFPSEQLKTSLKPKPVDSRGFDFEVWNELGTEILIRASYKVIKDTVTLEAYAYYVPQKKLVLGKSYSGPVSATRRIGHKFTNDLLKELTGKDGFFLSRIAVASDRAGQRRREIFVMDWDGANIDKITNHKSVALSPAWSPDATKVAYTAFVQRAKSATRNADLFVYELATGKRWLLSYRQGMNSGASFTPDGKHIVMTLSNTGSPDIFKINMDGEIVTRLTKGPLGAMNVEPSVSPNGSTVAFSTDRSGKPMLYTMGIDGSSAKRLTFAGTYNSSPAWSPDGKKIAFSGWMKDHFDIYVMDADGTNMVKITSAKKANGKPAKNEDPSFSPDGRLVMYTSDRTGNNQIYISNLDGSEERRITNDHYNYFKPKWSKNIE